LLPEENEMILGLIRQGHRKNTILALAVVKLYLAVRGEWKERIVGVVALTKDFGRKSYFFQIFDMQQCLKVWEQELYLELVYTHTVDLFHTFEAEHGMAGLSFADPGEANNFLRMVQTTQQRRARATIQLASRAARNKEGKKGVKGVKYPQKTKPKIEKTDIGAPQNPVHDAGMRKNSDGQMRIVGANFDLLDPLLLKACTMVGIDPAKVEAVTLRKAKEVADTKGVYKSYESNTSEHEKRRDLKRMTNYQSRFSAQGQGKLPPAPPLVFVERMERAFPPLPSFPPPKMPKHPGSGNPGGRSTSRSSPTPPPAPPPAPPVNVPKPKPPLRTPGIGPKPAKTNPDGDIAVAIEKAFETIVSRRPGIQSDSEGDSGADSDWESSSDNED